jgi:hypothetical protein
MTRGLTAVFVVLLLTNYAWSQSNCDQIRDAVDKYGYAAAREHAMTHYGIEAVKEGDKCLPMEAPPMQAAPTKPQPKHKPPKKRKQPAGGGAPARR